jgi:predicted peptidase
MPSAQGRYRSLACLTSVPSGPRPQEGWPVLVFLHGIGERAPAPVEVALVAHGPLHTASAPEARGRFVVVAPQLPASANWNGQAQTVREIASDVARDYQGNVRRMYLTGFSLGANGILHIAQDQRDVWAAVWLVDPTHAPPRKIERPIWISAGDRARQHKQALVATLTLQELGPAGPADRVYEDAGLDHVRTADRAYADSAIYTWLLRHERAEG